MYGCLKRLRREHLAEPHHVGTQQTSTAGTGRRELVGFGPGCDEAPIDAAFHPGDVAMQLDNFTAPGALVETVDVLGNQRELRDLLRNCYQRPVAGVRLGLGGLDRKSVV